MIFNMYLHSIATELIIGYNVIPFRSWGVLLLWQQVEMVILRL